jgi:hypothetical protein
MTSSSPTVKNRQTGGQKRARYGQARNLPAYQRDIDIKKIKTTKQGGAADIQQAPKPENRWDQFTKAVTTDGKLTMKFADVNAISDLVAWLKTCPICLRAVVIDFSAMGDTCAIALADALKVNTTVAMLDLSETSIGEEGAKALADTLKINTTLTALNLGWNEIGAEGVAALAEALQVNTTLTELNLCFTEIGPVGAAALADAMKINTTLTALNLFGSEVGAEGAAALADALKINRTLTALDLAANEIGAEGAAALADLLKVNRTLTTLRFMERGIGVEGLLAVADALKVNNTLTELALTGGYVGEEGLLALADALRVNTSLIKLSVNAKGLWKITPIRQEISALLERNKRLKLMPYAEASLDLLVRHSPALKSMGVPTDVLPLLAESLSSQVLGTFEQEWRDAFRASPPPIITTTTTNTTTTTTTTTTTDATIPTILTTSPAVTATGPASAPPVSTQPTATAADIKALLDDPNPVVAFSRWIDGHANPTAALNWVDPVNGYTLLHYAVVSQEGAVIRSLLARGIDTTRADQNNQTAAQLAQQRAESSSSSAIAAISALFKQV